MSDFRTELQKQYPLEGLGTRWDHYQELREVFALGVQILEGMDKKYRGKADLDKLVKLKSAVDLIDNRLNLLAGFDKAQEYNSNFAVSLRVLAIQAKAKNADWTQGMEPLQLEAKREPETKDSCVSSPAEDSGDDTEDTAGVS